MHENPNRLPPTQPYTRIFAPHPGEGSKKARENHWPLIIVWVATFTLSGGGGYYAHQHIDSKDRYERYAAELDPLIYYKNRLHRGVERGSNETMRIVNFKVYQAYRDGLNLPKLLAMAQPPAKHPSALTKLTTTRLIQNVGLAERYGIYDGGENLEAIAYGKAPKATKGDHSGERMDVEHLVPKALAPSLDNILANLMWLPAPLNQSKSDTITPEARQMAEIFHDQGILPVEEFIAIEKRFTEDQRRGKPR